MIKMSNHISHVPFIHVQGVGSMVVDRVDMASCDSRIDAPGVFAGNYVHGKISAWSADGIEVTISGDCEKLKRAFPIMNVPEWNGEGEPVPGQRVKIDGGEKGVVVLIGDFKLDKQRGAIIKMDGSGHLTMPMIISSLRPIERQLTTYEKNNIAAVERLVSAGVISEDLGKEAIQRVKDGTKS